MRAKISDSGALWNAMTDVVLSSNGHEERVSGYSQLALDEARAILRETEPWDGPAFCFRGDIEPGRAMRSERLALAESLAAFLED